MRHTEKKDTSWEKVSDWYNGVTGEKGHYYHRELIIPNILELLEKDFGKHKKILDLGCGQGILSRYISKKIPYLGIDKAPSLIKLAKKMARSPSHRFISEDISETFSLEEKDFSHAFLILCIQNIQKPLNMLKNAHAHIVENGKLIIVMNHPCFRIPRQTHWEIDKEKCVQFRRVDRYLSSLEIPIRTEPSKQEESPLVYSYHFPISSLARLLSQSGFCIRLMEEWASNKFSTGKYAKMENRARKEIPLFLTVVAEKLSD